MVTAWERHARLSFPQSGNKNFWLDVGGGYLVTRGCWTWRVGVVGAWMAKMKIRVLSFLRGLRIVSEESVVWWLTKAVEDDCGTPSIHILLQ